MKRLRKIEVNGEAFQAHSGELLLDAALMSGVDIPHDCRSGYCGTCRVRVLEGRVFGGQTTDSDEVHACQCRIISDVKVAVEDVPPISTETGRVTGLTRLAPDVIEVCIEVAHRPDHLPGQHYKVKFRGLPPRCYSPTMPLEPQEDDHLIRFHVRLVPGGRVSSALGDKVRVGHKVKLIGPLGSAYLRTHRTRRLVLVAGGTGFAPMWAIADAAMREKPERHMTFVVGARSVESLYMIPALCQLATFRNVNIVPVVAEPQNLTRAIREGRPTDHLPELSERDVVYAAGVPAMVQSVADMAEAANAKCYMDPFTPTLDGVEGNGFLSRAFDWLSGATPGSA